MRIETLFESVYVNADGGPNFDALFADVDKYDMRAGIRAMILDVLHGSMGSNDLDEPWQYRATMAMLAKDTHNEIVKKWFTSRGIIE